MELLKGGVGGGRSTCGPSELLGNRDSELSRWPPLYHMASLLSSSPNWSRNGKEKGSDGGDAEFYPHQTSQGVVGGGRDANPGPEETLSCLPPIREPEGQHLRDASKASSSSSPPNYGLSAQIGWQGST